MTGTEQGLPEHMLAKNSYILPPDRILPETRDQISVSHHVIPCSLLVINLSLLEMEGFLLCTLATREYMWTRFCEDESEGGG